MNTVTPAIRDAEYRQADLDIAERRKHERIPGDVWTETERQEMRARIMHSVVMNMPLVPLVETAEVPCDNDRCEGGYVERDLTNDYGDIYGTITVRCERCGGSGLRMAEVLSCCGLEETDCTHLKG